VFYRSKKTTENGYFRGGVSDRGTAQTAQFRAVRIISELVVGEFLWGTYGLGTISTRTKNKF